MTRTITALIAALVSACSAPLTVCSNDTVSAETDAMVAAGIDAWSAAGAPFLVYQPPGGTCDVTVRMGDALGRMGRAYIGEVILSESGWRKSAHCPNQLQDTVTHELGHIIMLDLGSRDAEEQHTEYGHVMHGEKLSPCGAPLLPVSLPEGF